MTLDKMILDKMAGDKMILDKQTSGKMTVDKMTANEMKAYQLWNCHELQIGHLWYNNYKRGPFKYILKFILIIFFLGNEMS